MIPLSKNHCCDHVFCIRQLFSYTMLSIESCSLHTGQKETWDFISSYILMIDINLTQYITSLMA